MKQIYDYAIILQGLRQDNYVTLHIKASTKKEALKQIGIFLKPYKSMWL